jgi:Protein of unknown function (DUF3455)
MHFLTLITFAAVLVMNLLCAKPTAASGSYQRRDLDTVKPVSELGWKVPLLSGETHGQAELNISDCAHFLSGAEALPVPGVGKKLKYLTLGRGVNTYECSNPEDDQPAFLHQNTDLYDVAPLAQNLPNEDALHSLVPRLREYDYAELRNTSMNCVGRIYNELDDTVVNLFGFNIPPFAIDFTKVIPPPTGQTTNGFWNHCATIDKAWEMYRVENSGGATPRSCIGHENSTIDVVYAAEYWFYHE